MKEIIITLIFITTSIVFSQKTEATIYFKDGTEKTGYVKYGPKPFANEIFLMDKVKYRKSKESKDIIEYEVSDISKIDLIKNGEILWTSYFKSSKKNPNIILEVTLEHKGDFSLYERLVDAVGPNSRGYTIFEYYVQKGEGKIEKIYPIGLFGNGSDKTMIKYFNNCVKLTEHIKNRTFEKYVKNHPNYKDKPKLRSRMIEIVKFYNSKCSQEN